MIATPRYKFIAASQTDSPLEVAAGKGGVGDILESLTVTPLTTAPGVVQIQDGSDTAITVYAGSAAYEASLRPFTIEINAMSRTGVWSITTGANVTVVATYKMR